MKDKHKIEPNQLHYLQNLANQHTTTVTQINQYIQEVNNGYQQKIIEGQYTIKKGHFQKSTNHNHNEFRQLKQYLSQREQLQKMKRSLDKNMKQQSRGSVLSDEQRLNFIKKIKQKQKQLSQQKERHSKIRQIEQKQLEEQAKMMKEFQESERKHSKRKQIERRLEELNQERERKLQQLRQRNKQFNQIKNQKTLLQKIQQNYQQQQMTLLQEKKRKLSQIREIHKPMSKSQFQQHMSRIVEYKKAKEQIKMRESQVKQVSPQSTTQFYKSHWYKNVIKEQKIDEEKLAQDQKQALRQLKDKQKKYAEYIKQNYVPDTDDKLADQIEKRIKTPIKRKKPKQIRQMGLDNLKICKEKALSKQQLQHKKNSELDRKSTTIEKHKDYLREFKKRRSSSLTELKLQSINGNEKQKLQTLKIYAQQLQNKAKQKLELQKIKKGLFDSEADELYMKALNAKLSLIPKQ